jgi:hypothetical protein
MGSVQSGVGRGDAVFVLPGRNIDGDATGGFEALQAEYYSIITVDTREASIVLSCVSFRSISCTL